MIDCNIHDNTALYGGGIENWANWGKTSMTMTNSNIYDNTALYGGGIYNTGTNVKVVFFDQAGNIINGYDPKNNDYLYFFGPTIDGPDNTADDFYS